MKLASYLSDKSIHEFADALGVARQTVYRWKHGEAIPRFKHMAEIERLTKGAVKPNDFWSPNLAHSSQSEPAQ